MIRFPPTPISRAHAVVGSGLALVPPAAARITQSTTVDRRPREHKQPEMCSSARVRVKQDRFFRPRSKNLLYVSHSVVPHLTHAI